MGVQSHAVRCRHPRRARRAHQGLVRRTGAGGFTLIELLVVIGIIAVLAAIVIPVYTRAQEKGRQANCIANMHAIGVAMRMYQMDYDAYPQSLQTTVKSSTYTDHYVGYDPVSGTGGISALYRGEYLTDPQVLRCKDDPTTLADYMNRYEKMETTVWEPGDPTASPAVPPSRKTYTGPTILEWLPLHGALQTTSAICDNKLTT